MTFLSTSEAEAVESDVMNPYAYGLERRSGTGASLAAALDAWFSDKRLDVSRPKLLFAVSSVDAAAIVVSGVAAARLTHAPGATLSASTALSAVLALMMIAVLRRNWSYTIASLRRPAAQIGKIVKSFALVFCLVAGAAHIAGTELFPSATAIVWLLLAIPALVTVRFAVARIVERFARAGRLVRRTVIVGGGPDAEALIGALESETSEHLKILGVFDDRNDERSSDSVAGYAKLGNFDQLVAFCRNAGVDLLIVTVPLAAEQRLLEILGRLFTLPVDVRISALGSRLRLNPSSYSYVGRVPMLAVMDRPLTDWDRVVKNIEDRLLGVILLVIAAPIMALIALAIRLDSKGPVFFRQRRYGFNNELIEIWKFRSMHAGASDPEALRLVTKDDPRVTRVGRFIRRTSLDELPQLFNVLRGEMSLVGPRPHATRAKAQSDLYQSVVDGYFARHRMKPGITGWAQVNGWRGETDTHDKIRRRVEADLYYIDNWSVLLDLYILALTPLALLSQRNAY